MKINMKYVNKFYREDKIENEYMETMWGSEE